MIGIWFIPKTKKCYSKYVRFACFYGYYKVGYINSYGHELITLFYVTDKKLVQCTSMADYYIIKRENGRLKNRLINRIIYLLNKLK